MEVIQRVYLNYLNLNYFGENILLEKKNILGVQSFFPPQGQNLHSEELADWEMFIIQNLNYPYSTANILITVIRVIA